MERLTSVDELKAFPFLKMNEVMLEVLDSLQFDSMDSLGLIMETMADVTKDTEELSTNARVGAHIYLLPNPGYCDSSVLISSLNLTYLVVKSFD